MHFFVHLILLQIEVNVVLGRNTGALWNHLEHKETKKLKTKKREILPSTTNLINESCSEKKTHTQNLAINLQDSDINNTCTHTHKQYPSFNQEIASN